MLSIVLATRNRADLLRDALDSIAGQEQGLDDVELVVIDDDSADETPSVVEDLRTRVSFPVRLIPNDGRAQNAGRNTGIRQGRGDIVLFLDDDEELPPHYLATLHEIIETQPDAQAYGGPALEKPGALRTCRHCTLANARVAPNSAGDYERLLGGNMAIRRHALDAVGEFNPALIGLGNEVEWFERAQGSGGLRIVYDERLAVWHRRDYESWWSLMSKAFREGRKFHLYLESTGKPIEPHFGRVMRHVGHAVVRRCAKGAFLAARELGRSLGAVGARSSRNTPNTA